MSIPAPVDIGSLIWYPAARNGRACLGRTTITVAEVAAHYRRGESAEAVARAFPATPKSLIFAALAYYLANQERFDTEWEIPEDAGEFVLAARK